MSKWINVFALKKKEYVEATLENKSFVKLNKIILLAIIVITVKNVEIVTNYGTKMRNIEKLMNELLCDVKKNRILLRKANNQNKNTFKLLEFQKLKLRLKPFLKHLIGSYCLS